MRNDSTINVNTTSCISFSAILTLVFVVLKLCKVISWNWFWVLCPLIFGAGLDILVLIIFLILALFTGRRRL